MRTKSLRKAKLVVAVESNRETGRIRTVSVYDNRTGSYWEPDRIAERGILCFMNMNDMKETLNWNLNGDGSKYQFGWGQSGKLSSEGKAYIFD